MHDHPVLAQVALGYSPMIDRQRAVVATRLTVFPAQPDSDPDPHALLRALEEVWPAADGLPALKLTPRPLDPASLNRRAASTTPLVSLNLAGETLLRQMMGAAPGPQLMVEVPAFMASDPVHVDALQRLHAAGTVMLIKGRPLTALAPELLRLFSHSIVDAGEDRRSAAPPPAGVRQVTTVQAGAHSSADIEAAFQRGAVATLGWPWDDAPAPLPAAGARRRMPTDINTVMELINGVDRQAPVPQLEAVLRGDPTLAFRLMRYLNSPAFGLSVEIHSFGHAIMMLGYQRLKRWLALLLVSSAKGINARPLTFAAVRRGLLMEELGRQHADPEMRSEMFICGVFSLIDRLLQQPMADLLASLPLPDGVQQALRSDLRSEGGAGGPYAPYLRLVRAIEQESLLDIRAISEALMLGPAAVNRAVLMALQTARQLDG